MIKVREEITVSIRQDPTFARDFALVTRRSFYEKLEALNDKGEWIDAKDSDLIRDNEKLKVAK